MNQEIDERFKIIATDPRFRMMKRKDRKVKIDSRFSKMFKDKRFRLQYSADKRGRKICYDNLQDLKKVYDVSSEDDKDDETDEDSDFELKTNEKKLKDLGSDEKISYSTSKELIKTDLRGKRNSDISSSSDEQSSDEEEDEEIFHEWGELDNDALHEDKIFHRLAVCNIDWDRIKAEDLFVLFNSFLIKGSIESVRIYVSEFGKERIEKEKIKGPTGLVEEVINEPDSKIDYSNIEANEVGIDADDPAVSEKLRKYQISRLRYYYAIITTDSAQTAAHLYEQLDGYEYESSASTLDIRFVSDDLEFEDPKWECLCLPAEYKPSVFVTTALQQSKVRLTWDETDPLRKKKLESVFKEGNYDDLEAYLADENEDEDIKEIEINEDCDKIQKYKQLLKELDEENSKEKRNLEEEIEKESEESDTISSRKSKKRLKGKKKKDEDENIEDKNDKEYMSLLTMDEEKNEFEFNAEDERFSSIYHNHLYNIDPSNKSFKRTKGMEKILANKIKKT